MLGFVKEFKEFLKEYKVVGLAVGIIMGLAATALVNALVNDIIMPIVTPFIQGGAWATATLTLGRVVISWGHFLGALINFIILAFVVFIIAKFIIKEEKISKK